MRLFVALEIPDTVKARLIAAGESLDREGNQARWVRAESIHLTLRFLGEVDPRGVAALERALEPIRAPRLDVRVEGIGFFPVNGRPRVIWAGIVSGGIEALARDVDRAVGRIGFREESRTFRPHLTLARSRGKGTIGRALVLAARELGDAHFGSFTRGSFVVYQSHLTPGGAIYQKMSEFVFDSASR